MIFPTEKIVEDRIHRVYNMRDAMLQTHAKMKNSSLPDIREMKEYKLIDLELTILTLMKKYYKILNEK